MSRSRLPGRSETPAFIGLGGNIGDPVRAMGQALRAIDGHAQCRVARVSDVYRTPPWGVTDQPDFRNACACVMTTLSGRDFLAMLLDLETRLHRVRERRWGPRTIDLDILVFGDAHIDEEGLQVPHPRMLERGFVLVPLAEIAPDLVIEGETASARARAFAGEAIRPAGLGPNWWQA